MLLISREQVEAFERLVDGTLGAMLTREIALIRANIPEVDQTTPAEEIIAQARRFSQQYGLEAESDIRNLVITFIFADHAESKQRSICLHKILSSSHNLTKPLCAHALAAHAGTIERDYNWRKEQRQ